MSVYRLREQVVASGRNAVLLVPQGPKDAPHSGDGKLELDEDGFLRFMTEVATWLHDNGNVPSARTGRIVLSAHSGGYGGAGGVLQRGGRNDAITDVLLFDAAYWYFAAFSDWGESVAATPPLERVHRRHEHRQHRLDGHRASAGTKPLRALGRHDDGCAVADTRADVRPDHEGRP